MPIIHHHTIPQRVVTRSGVPTRPLVTQASGSQHCTLWEQVMPVGGAIPLHSHPSEEIIVILSGVVAATLDGVTTEVNANTTLFFPARCVHGLRNIGNGEVRLLAFFPTNDPQATWVADQQNSTQSLYEVQS